MDVQTLTYERILYLSLPEKNEKSKEGKKRGTVMSKSFIVSVEPKVLIWARESIGMNKNAVAQRIKGITVNTIEDWEKGKANPTFSQLKRLTSIYKRPLTAFLLPTPPEEAPFPTDYRTFSSKDKKPFHPKTQLKEVKNV